MRYFTNHCWCNASHWDNNVYDCRYIVSFDPIIHTKTLGYDDNVKDPDFDLLLDKRTFFDVEDYERMVEIHKGSKYEHIILDKKFFNRKTPVLKPHVQEWLNENVLPRPKCNGNTNGWCMGNDSYNYKNSGFSVFFHRKRDAMNFIKHFSVFGKPTCYFDYFKDKRSEMNPDQIKKIIELNTTE